MDAGDLFGRRNRTDKIQTEFLCEVTGSFGYDAIGVGEQDLNYGLNFLQRMIEEHGLPFTSANVRHPETGELIMPEYRIVERAGIRFGIISVLDANSKIITMTGQDAGFQIDDPVATLRELIPRLRREVDTIVVLSHMGDNGTEDLVGEVGGIDVAVVGHSFRPLRTERAVHRTVVLNAVHEGRYLGRADMLMSPSDGQVKAVEIAITGLDNVIEDDPAVKQQMDAFLAEIKASKDAQRAKYPRDLGSNNERFLGERACKSCHEATWVAYAKTGHKRAFTSLRSKNTHFEPDCLVCHTTGYRHHNGYEQGANLSHLTSVQCEACHGYGTLHARDGEWAKQAAESCMLCHDLSNSPHADDGYEFDYANYWEKIKH